MSPNNHRHTLALINLVFRRSVRMYTWRRATPADKQIVGPCWDLSLGLRGRRTCAPLLATSAGGESPAAYPQVQALRAGCGFAREVVRTLRAAAQAWAEHRTTRKGPTRSALWAARDEESQLVAPVDPPSGSTLDMGGHLRQHESTRDATLIHIGVPPADAAHHRSRLPVLEGYHWQVCRRFDARHQPLRPPCHTRGRRMRTFCRSR